MIYHYLEICQYLKNEKVAHQYSLLGDIYKMYQSVANITFNQIQL